MIIIVIFIVINNWKECLIDMNCKMSFDWIVILL